VFEDMEKTMYLYLLGKYTFTQFKRDNFIPCEDIVVSMFGTVSQFNQDRLKKILCNKEDTFGVSLEKEEGWFLWMTSMPQYDMEVITLLIDRMTEAWGNRLEIGVISILR
jgi:hypothetical protein